MSGNRRFLHHRLGRPWCEALELENGRRLILRPIQPSDRERLQRSFARLTPEEIRFRFLRPIQALSDRFASRLVEIDPKREFALAIVEAIHPREALIGGVARAVIDAGGRDAEFAIIVGREISGQGLATYLLGKLISWCRKKRLHAIYGDALVENFPMLQLADKLGFEFLPHPDQPDLIRMRKVLRDTAR